MPSASCFRIFLALCLIWLAAMPAAQAQIAFRGAASGTALLPQYRSQASAAASSTVTYRNQASAATTTGTLTIARPTGVLEYDMLIASIGVTPSTATLTPPAGWTLIRRTNNAGPTSNSLAVYRKLATGAEPASYAWTVGGGSYTVGGIQAFYNVDTTTPVDVENGQATASALTHATPSVATTVANAMVVTSHTFASSRNWTPPAAMTESFDRRSGANSATGQSVEGNRVLQAAAGATGVKTATAAANADAGATHILALKPMATLRITRPAGVVVNDVLIASVGVTPSTTVITPPTGWTLVRRIDNPGPTSNSLAVYRKVATAAEPASYAWPLAGVSYGVGGIQAFYGVDTTTPIDAEAGQATAVGRDHATPTITTTVANTLLVGSYTYASSQSWAPRTPPAPAMTESFERLSGAASATGQSVEGTRLLKTAAGLVPAYTSRAAGAAVNYDAGATHMLALRPANTVLTIPLPVGTVANDVMIASIGVTPSSVTVTPPAGWVLANRRDNNAGATNSLLVYSRVAGAAEPAAYSWSVSGNFMASGGIQSFSGADTTTPIDVQASQTTNSSLNHATPSVTTTVANTMLVTSHTFNSAATWTPPAGMTEGFDVTVPAANYATGQATEGNYVLQAAAGATGAKTATASANADRGNTHILALRRAVVPSSFNAFEQPAGLTCATLPNTTVTGPIKTKIAGTAYMLCVVALDSSGPPPQILAAFNGTVKVDVLANINTGVALDANGCPTTSTQIYTSSAVALVNGKIAHNFTAEPNAWRDVRVRIGYPAALPTVMRCSADNFAIRPNTLVVAASDNDAQTAGILRNLNNTATPGGTVHKAGQPFTLRGTAWNAAAVPVVTSNYDGSPTANITAHLIPAACRNGGGCTVSAGSFAASGGTVRSDTASYNEVGAFNLELVDATFANVDVADSSAAEREIRSTSVGVGRFVPDHFVLQAGSAVTPACTSGGSAMSYMGQGFGVSATLAAQNAANATTWNYHSTAYAPGAVSWVAENSDGGTNLGARLSGLTAAWTDGLYAVSTGSALFGRLSPDNPDGPYDGLQLGAQLTDPDGPTLNGQDMNAGTVGDCVLASNCNARSAGTPSSLRFGRLRMGNAAGSDLIDLPVPLRTDYWNGTAFAINSTDNCTTLAANNIALSNWQGNLNACETSVFFLGGATPFTGGLLNSLRLDAPGATNRGSVQLTANLGAAGSGTTCLATGGATSAVSGASRPWLYGRWDDASDPDANASTNYDDNPSARGTFGIFRDRVLYRRENY